jgi:leucyl aminopeptidase
VDTEDDERGGLAVLGAELPEVLLATDPPSRVPDADVVAVAVIKDGDDLVLGPGSRELLDDLGVDLLRLLAQRDAMGSVGEVIECPVLRPLAAADEGAEETFGAALLVGVGERTPRDLRRAGAALARRVRGRERVATSVAADAADDGLQAFVEGLLLGSFGFTRRTSPPRPAAVAFVLAGLDRPGDRERAVERARTLAAAGWSSRVLALTPSNEKNPAWLAAQAAMVAERAGLSCRQWDERQLAADGFGGLVGVGQASATPPRLVQLGYVPARGARRAPHVVLAGKGITFDSGGLSLKPADAMASMKRDMTGAGVVLAVMAGLRAIGCPLRVTGLLACAENAVGGSALRPGDVLRHYGGRTTEVSNTDAEGRLVLADVLAYAADRLEPTALVDVATLTGAVKVTLGQRLGGLFATDDALAARLLAAGAASGEPLWRLPLVDDYEDLLESRIADADNAGGSPGAVTAALFLRHFTGGLPWAHLDIASVGDSPTDAFEWSSGATGFGARLLLHWLSAPDPLGGLESKHGRPGRLGQQGEDA